MDTSTTFDPALCARYADIEDRHFWFRTRTRLITELARQVTAGLAPGYRVLEVGCGTGVLLRALESACTGGHVTGLDLYHEALSLCRSRSRAALIQADVRALPLTAGFSLVGMFDMLEHLPDDRAILDGLFGLVAPGGALILTVPAHASLWSYFDEANHHCRRYEPAELSEKLTRAGFAVEYLSNFMAATFPLIWLKRRWSGRDYAPAERTPDRARQLAFAELSIVPGVNGLLECVLAAEVALLARRVSLPFGSSLVAIARRVSK